MRSAVVALLLTVAGCGVQGGGTMDDDAYLEKILSTNPHKQEAGAWLEQKDGKERAVGDGEQDAAASSRLVRDLYRRGAVDVTAVDIEADAHLETTSTLIVTLPQEPEARRRVLQVEAKVARRGGFGPSADVGQRYIMLHW